MFFFLTLLENIFPDIPDPIQLVDSVHFTSPSTMYSRCRKVCPFCSWDGGWASVFYNFFYGFLCLTKREDSSWAKNLSVFAKESVLCTVDGLTVRTRVGNDTRFALFFAKKPPNYNRFHEKKNIRPKRLSSFCEKLNFCDDDEGHKAIIAIIALWRLIQDS